MEPNKVQRTVKFFSKVKTGCLTCKKRKVKCDEVKPHCRRCTGSGRKCEGYPQDRPSPPPMSVGAGPESHSVLFASPAERRSFFYFQSQACKPLGGHFNSSFWGREVMQAAIHYPPVRHLVIAIGSAYEAFESGSTGQETQFILQQCNQSIGHLTTLGRPTDAPSVEVTCCILTASLLFVYLASIRGHHAEAFQHVRSAAKVLQDFERSAGLTQKPNGTTPVLASFSHRLRQIDSRKQWPVIEDFKRPFPRPRIHRIGKVSPSYAFTT
ncbi:uncharacterized protein B0H64DRAFT_427660 [Chaetomium fimeti]|uniref:Zn(2)-C6 fungal-type domain-containing protein n=1 Tax=Chaetomium fimeti TaxID=1854472 RepID=A0AAE0H5J7_9PEZI|nr:hypothetical protein B0H64DRAFT_427660 [Chaetomium fimeti]